MIRHLFLLCFAYTSVFAGADLNIAHLTPSTPEQMAGFYGDELIAGMISPLSGQPVVSKTDLIARGAQDVQLHRIYVPAIILPEPPAPPGISTAGLSKEKRRKLISKHRKAKIEYQRNKWRYWAELQSNVIGNRTGWRVFPQHRVLVWHHENSSDRTAYLGEANGAVFAFTISEKGSSLLTATYGMSNASGDIPSGAYDPRNLRISCQGTQMTVLCPDGTTRIYTPEHPYSLGLGGPFRIDYILRKEILPSGKVLRYSYEVFSPASKHRLSYGYKLRLVESLDPKERYTYASLTIDGSLVMGWDTNFHFTTNSGEYAHYYLDEKIWNEKYRDKNQYGKPCKMQCEEPMRFPSVLSAVSSPFYRSETLHHNHLMQLGNVCGKEAPYKYAYSGSPLRIDSVYVPSGENDTFVLLYKMKYEPPVPGKKGGRTVAERIDGSKMEYSFNSKFLMDGIKWYNPDGKLGKEKYIHWTAEQRLKGIELKDGDGALLYARFYECDAYGNPEVEVFEGDLTGEGKYEKYTIRRKFSQDGKHLLLKEEHEDGKAFLYKYLPGTNLLTAKYTLEQDKIFLREFYAYDDCHNLIEKILDDGEVEDARLFAGVTQRTIARYHLRQKAPFLHCPEWIEELYWDGRQEKLLKKTQLFYDKIGHIEREDIYGADGVFAYTTSRTTDEQGNVLSETDSLGRTATTEFTPKGQPKLAISASKRLQKKMNYDLAGRLYKVEEKGDEGTLHTTVRKFDTLDRCKEEIDFFGLSTTYTYDPLTGQAKHIEKPPILSYDQRKVSISSSSIFDALGRERVKIDPRGYRTQLTYNAYGKVTSISHPDGFQERYLYYANGNLKTAIDVEGTKTFYKYNSLGAVRSKTISSQKGEVLSKEKFSYKSSLLTQIQDAEGRIIRFYYDGAGRKIAQDNGMERTEWTYDEMSRVYSIKKVNGNETQVSITLYDFLDRPIEERKEDLSGSILSQQFYEYDSDSNKSVIISWSQGKKAKETFDYDPFHRLVRETDALEYVTEIQYDENVLNALGQKVLRKTETDPMGLKTIELFDAPGHIASTEKRKDRTLSLERYYRDANSNLTTQVSDIYTSGDFQRSSAISWDYDCRNRNTSLTEAYGTSDAKTTRYIYTSKGQLFQTVKPDGIVIERTYDGLGYLKTLFSSDQSCQYFYRHNRLGEMLELKDLLTQQSIVRTYDTFGRMIQEKQAIGFSIQNSYDAMNRRTLLTLPDKTAIVYRYDPLYLREVERLNALSQPAYSHYYLEYDLSGHLLRQQLIGSLGYMEFSYNALGCKTLQSHVLGSQQVEEFDARGNILKLTTNSTLGSDTSEYTYDDLSQLESESGLFNNCYSADSHYNRVQKNDSAYHINDLNQIVEVEGETIKYDLNGNPILKNGVRYSYDALDRLVERASSSSRLTFTYDGLHRRLSKNIFIPSSSQWQLLSTEYYLYDGQNEIGVISPEGTLQTLRVLGSTPHAEIGASVALELGQNIYAPLHDLCENVAFLAAPATSSLVEAYRYSAFGEEKIYAPANQITKTQVGNFWRFSSKRKDDESGLIYYGRRYYDPELGRWQTPDPAGFTDGMNLYAFVHNDPLIYLDDYGLWMEHRPQGGVYSQQQADSMRQLSFGAMHCAVDTGFSLLKFGNMACHGLMSPFRSFDWQNKQFNFSMGSSYNAVNQWLDQTHEKVNQTLFTSEDRMSTAFKTGDRCLGTAQNLAAGLGIARGAYCLGRGLAPLAMNGFSKFSGYLSRNATPAVKLNRFHQAASNLSETGQNNIRTLRGWAKSKGWEKLPNPEGRPEIWGVNRFGRFESCLKIKAEPSLRQGLDIGSGMPRFDARLSESVYVNPFTGQIGGTKIGKHIPLEHRFYE